LQLWRDAKGGDIYQATQVFGSRWCYSAEALVLEVPSIVCPVENNYLINPKYPDFAKIQELSREVVTLDNRLLSTLKQG
jgi:RES domain-containing protein